MNKVDKKKKTENIQALIEQAWLMGTVRINLTAHAVQRSKARAIDGLDLREVIFYGYHEESSDRWHGRQAHWTYALRNKNVDGRDIRIIFDVEGYPDVVVVTVMHVYP